MLFIIPLAYRRARTSASPRGAYTRAQSRLRRGMAEESGSTSDALRVITEKLEELTSSMTVHEKTMKEREIVHVA